VHNGNVWILTTGYSGNNILGINPGFSITSYVFSEIVDGQNIVHNVAGSAPTDRVREINNTSKDIYQTLSPCPRID
jgi:hypothetical protein